MHSPGFRKILFVDNTYSVPSEYIDYNTCNWMYRGGGDVTTCPTGYVAVGACGNKGQNRCSGKAHGLQCCRMKKGGN